MQDGQGAWKPVVRKVVHTVRRGRKAGEKISWRMASGQEVQEDHERCRRKEEKWARGGEVGRDVGKKRYRKHR